ncbi:MAG: hypothetical protein JWP27_2329 [Flaviaesturariibacter sp.]|nr:hypothetical protein [Flaviaesturariibacter sp.]
MKQFLRLSTLLILLTFVLTRCAPGRELQAQVVSAELVRIDTVERYNGPQLYLTWKCSNNVTYVTQTTAKANYHVGSQMTMMVQR